MPPTQFWMSLKKKLDSDRQFKTDYSTWYEEHNLRNRKPPGQHTAVVRAVTGAPSPHNTPLSMYFRSPLRQIQFKQGRNYTCAFSSLCSAIYAFANGNDKIKQFASLIHAMRQPNHDTQLIGNLKQAIDRVTKGQFIFTNFQVHNQYEPGPVLGFLMDEKGATEHAVSFWGKEIFDSNLNFTLARGDSLMETKKF
jgi:hypothetical protein